MRENLPPFVLVSWGQLKVQSSLQQSSCFAAIFIAIMPLATLVLAHYLTGDEKLNDWKLAGVLCGLALVIVLTGVALSRLGNRTHKTKNSIDR